MTLTPEDRELLREAKQALGKAYARYSSFKVGAAVRTRAGNIYLGCNVENVSYPVGTCAERNAIAAAVLAEGPTTEIIAIAIAARDRHDHWASVTPCGACRQAIHEFGRAAKVVFTDANQKPRTESIQALLPESFSF
jgi:cytidine deaminase